LKVKDVESGELPHVLKIKREWLDFGDDLTISRAPKSPLGLLSRKSFTHRFGRS